jgi:tricorn protease
MRTTTLTLVVFLLLSALADASGGPLLVRRPALTTDTIVFEFGSDLWTVPRDGGRARRLTVGQGVEDTPCVSPDGQWVAFTGDYDGNADVYVVPISGGQPRRLTYHPTPDVAVAWSPDGRSVLFASGMDRPDWQPRLYTVPATGGWPSALPLPRGAFGSFSPDGSHIAYTPFYPWQPDWKRYKGGQTTPVWIARLSDSRVESIPRNNSNDRSPMWVGESIYFLSDRDGRTTLYGYDTRSKRVSRLLPPGTLDIKNASAGPGAIVFERMGGLYLYDLRTRTERRVPIEIDDDFVEARPTQRNVSSMAQVNAISPSGARIAIEARGEVFTVPVAKGDARNLTRTPGVAERTPIWSPDGSKIAFLSDADGDYKLHVVDQMGTGTPDVYSLTIVPNAYHGLTWSPDGKRILFIDRGLCLHTLDLETRVSTLVDREPYYFIGESIMPSWSPDGKWIAYTKRGKNKLRAVHLYSVESGQTAQVTDGLSDASNAAFDRSGKYLYFVASTDLAQTVEWASMSSMTQARGNYTPYLIVLNANDPSPFSPESDEERPAPSAGGTASGGTQGASVGGQLPEVTVDLDDISQRILSLPVSGSFTALVPASPNTVMLVTSAGQMIRFSLETRRAAPFAEGVSRAIPTPQGDKVLLIGPGGTRVVGTQTAVQPGQGVVNTGGLTALVNPRAEWRQMFNEVWRNYRDFFYDPNVHGLDIAKAKARYEPYLDGLVSRHDYNYLMVDMLNEVSAGHISAGGGEVPEGPVVPGGLLGADYSIDQGRYRFARVYSGENWNPSLRAPLTQPGATVKAGEYLLAVNGRELTSAENVYAAFEGTADRQVKITVGPHPDGTGSRVITVVPVSGEEDLRSRAWVEDNRRKVQEMSGGRISYIYVPNTSRAGLESFNRYFTAQLGKDAVLVDARFNSGGLLADYIVQILSRRVLANAAQRDNEDFTVPVFVNEGPKAMLINEYAGSGGDALPWFFREMKLGPLIGTRTWGGLVGGMYAVPLMGGGFATTPQVGIYGLRGEWEMENGGCPPDIEVIEDPYLWRQGRDPQLESAVKYLMEQLAKNPPRTFQRPPFPNYHRDSGLGRGG